MLTFNQFIVETFINLLPKDKVKKNKHAEEVHDMLTKSYKDQGGIHGSGFKNPGDMVDNIPMWKLHRHEGKIKAAALYKDSQGRKRVAIGTDGSSEGKKAAAHIMLHDLKQDRSYGETSGKSLSFMKKHIPDFHKHVNHYDKVEEHFKKTNDSIKKTIR